MTKDTHYRHLRPPEPCLRDIQITSTSSIDDLFAKYPDIDPSTIKQIYQFNDKDIQRTDFDLKEMSLEPTTSSLSKKSSNNQKIEEEMSDEDKLTVPDKLNKKTTSQQPLKPKLEEETVSSPQMTESHIGEIIKDFKDHHKNTAIPKPELDQIVDVVREGVKGIDYNEEKFLKAQCSSDLMLLQAFIETKLQSIKQASYVDNGVNIHNKEEFPTLGDSFEGKKKKGKASGAGSKKKNSPVKEPPPKPVNLLDELVADKIAKENENKTEELVNIKLSDRHENVVFAETEQPITKWVNYEENLFVMGNVSAAYLVDTAGELLQAP